MTTTAERFAQAVRTRYLRAVARNALLPRVVRRALVLAPSVQHISSITVAPRIHVAFNGHTLMNQIAPARILVSLGAPQHRTIELIRARTIVREERPLLRGSAKGGRRAELVHAAPLTRSAAVVERVARSARVPRVLQRAPRPDDRTSLQHEPAVRRSVVEPAVALPAAELERVTSHVMHALDRRMTAWRERSGRI
jgi:hypothetical protein